MEYQKLFDHMSNEHGLTLIQSEMQDIIDVVREIDGDGWVKIESEKDLPKQRGQEDVWVFDESGIVCAASSVHLNDPEIRRYWMKTVSHHHPIQKPEPPKH